MGIPADLLPRVFDLFVQGDRALDRAQGGLGIGLSLVKRLVELHDGTVTVESAGRDRGARFEIRLPQTTLALAAAEDGEKPEAASRRVLVVDDNADAADSLAMILRLDGHAVEACYSAEAALDIAAAFRPQAALLDIGLPGMDGYTLAARLRASGADGHAMLLVALTGYGQSEDKAAARRAGFDEHLVKPAGLDALRRMLARVPH